jgi:hypothetical protein
MLTFYALEEMVQPYLPKNGGNIILAQIENEYNDDSAAGKKYIQWYASIN